MAAHELHSIGENPVVCTGALFLLLRHSFHLPSLSPCLSPLSLFLSFLISLPISLSLYLSLLSSPSLCPYLSSSFFPYLSVYLSLSSRWTCMTMIAANDRSQPQVHSITLAWTIWFAPIACLAEIYHRIACDLHSEFITLSMKYLGIGKCVRDGPHACRQWLHWSVTIVIPL